MVKKRVKRRRELTGNHAVLYLVVVLLVFSGVFIVKEGFFGEELRFSTTTYCGGYDLSGRQLPGCDCGDTLFSYAGGFEYTLSTSDPIVGSTCSGGGLIIGADNIILDCGDNLLQGNNGDQIGIKVDGFSGVEVKNCKIENFGEGIYVGDSFIILEDNEIRNNYIESFSGGASDTGILVEGTSWVEMNDNIVCDNGDIDFECTGADSNSNIDGTGNKFDNVVGCFNGWPVYGEDYNYCQEDESSSLCGTTITDDLELTEDISCFGEGLIIGADDITIDCGGYTLTGSSRTYGIYIANQNGVEIKDCKFKGFKRQIFLEGADSNNVYDNEIVDSLEDGIYLKDSSYNIIEGNVVSDNGRIGIVIINDSNSNTVEGNIINGMDENACVGLYQESDDNIFKENVLDGCLFGVEIWKGSDSNEINYNTINNSAGRGINILNESTNNTLSYNIIENSSEFGIYLDEGSFDNVFSYNNIIDSVAYNMYNNQTDNVSAENNWWGSADEVDIRIDIYDYEDDQSLGVVDYSPWLNEEYVSSGAGHYICKESWNCTGWDECGGGVQSRNCTDLNKCGTDESIPVLNQSCYETECSFDSDCINEYCVGGNCVQCAYDTHCLSGYECSSNVCVLAPIVDIEDDDEGVSLFWIILIPLLVFVLVLGVVLVIKYKDELGLTKSASSSKSKKSELESNRDRLASGASDEDRKLAKFVLDSRKAGYSNEKIKRGLLKAGWSESKINRLLKE